LQNKLVDTSGRPKVLKLGNGLSAQYHKSSNSFVYTTGENKGKPVEGLALRNLWNKLGVGIGGTDKGKKDKEKRDPFQRAKAWLQGTGKSDTAIATRLDPKASMFKKAFVGGAMALFKAGIPEPGKIQLDDKTIKALQNFVNKGQQEKMKQAFNDAIAIGKNMDSSSAGKKPGEWKSDDAEKEATAQFNKVISQVPGMEGLLIMLAQKGQFVPALQWVNSAQPMTTNLLPHQAKSLPKPQGKLPAPQGKLPAPQGKLPAPQGRLPAPKTTKRGADGRYTPGNQSGVQFDKNLRK
jgi:hypothetical protein